MQRSLPRQYWLWLYGRVCTVRDIESPLSYTLVCDEMHMMDFQVFVPNDGNRASDGADLRDEFIHDLKISQLDPQFERMMHEPTVFEVLVALTDRARLMTGMSQERWFAIFLENLGLDRYNDRHCITGSTIRIRRNLRRFNNRTYSASGRGGLFPLRDPLQDQRRIELWYQMGAYINQEQLY